MNTLKKSLKLAGALAIVLGAASPLMATSASAAPYGHGSYGHHETYRGGHGKYDAMRDRNHRPQVRYERHGRAPHAHMKWREGRWNWSRDHWAWAPGIWIRF
jgi:hypothetical protein